MDTKVACLLLIILGALTVQGAVSGNKRMNPLYAKSYGSECLIVPFDDNRTLFKLYFLTDLWTYPLDWTAILRLFMEHDSLFASKQTIIFCFCLQFATPSLAERFASRRTRSARMDIKNATSTARMEINAAACKYGFLAGNYLFYLLTCQYFNPVFTSVVIACFFLQ